MSRRSRRNRPTTPAATAVTHTVEVAPPTAPPRTSPAAIWEFVQNAKRDNPEMLAQLQAAMSPAAQAELIWQRRGFRDLSSKVAAKNLREADQERVLNESWHLYKNCPLYRDSINKTTAFIMGDGLVIRGQNDDAQGVINDLLGEGEGSFRERLDVYARYRVQYAEYLNPTFVGSSAKLRVAYRDPLDIYQMVPDADDSSLLALAVMKDDRGGPGMQYPIIQQNLYATTDEELYRVALGEDGKLRKDGPLGAFYCGPERELNGTRSYPPYSAGHPWFNMHDEYIRGVVDRADILTRILFMLAVKGDDKEFSRLQEEMTLFGRPSDPSVLLTNGNVEGKFETPGIQSDAVDVVHKILLHQIAHATGLSVPWFTQGDELAYASAKEIGFPTLKVLQTLQTGFLRWVRSIVAFQLWVAQRMGRINLKPEDRRFVIVPSAIIREDEGQKLDRATKALILLQMMKINQWEHPDILALVSREIVRKYDLPLPAEDSPERQAAQGEAAAPVQASRGKVVDIYERVLARNQARLDALRLDLEAA